MSFETDKQTLDDLNLLGKYKNNSVYSLYVGTITLFNENQYQEAEECLNRAVRLRPAEFKTVYNRGKLRLKLGNIEGAIADLDKATTLKPEHARAHELFGDALMQTGKEVEAALQWRLAEELRKKRSSK